LLELIALFKEECGVKIKDIYTGVVHVLKHSRNPRERRAESLKGIGPELSEQWGE
jgi:hypothetical protein